MRYAANGMCGDVTATTAVDPAFTRTGPTAVINGLAEPAGCHPQGNHPCPCVAARRRDSG
jgi:hypothetical protein